MSNFVTDCLSGKAKPEDLDDYLSAWHASDSALPAIDYLGLTWEEYGQWLMDSKAIVGIIESKRRQQAAKKKTAKAYPPASAPTKAAH